MRLPSRRISIVRRCADRVISACACESRTMISEHVVGPVILQFADHPSFLAPTAGRARSVTSTPSSKVAVHRGGQEIPAGVLVTRPSFEGVRRSLRFGGALHWIPTPSAIARTNP
jgi:hypothetical protein